MFDSIVKKEMDEFVDIIGYEGYYQINRNGEVKSIAIGRGRKNKILKTRNTRDGYSTVDLRKKEKRTHHSIHRLLGLQFIPNPENKPTIDHIDRNRQNNSIENLRWATYMEQNENTRIFGTGISRSEAQKKQDKKYNAWKSITKKLRQILLE